MAVTMLPCPRRPVGAVVNGCPPDKGVMVKLGMAIAWEAPVFLLRDDVRRRTDSETYPLNLMLFIGLPETGRDASWHASIGELADLEKAPGRWLTGPVAGECSRRGPGDGRGSGSRRIASWLRFPACTLPGARRTLVFVGLLVFVLGDHPLRPPGLLALPRRLHAQCAGR